MATPAGVMLTAGNIDERAHVDVDTVNMVHGRLTGATGRTTTGNLREALVDAGRRAGPHRRARRRRAARGVPRRPASRTTPPTGTSPTTTSCCAAVCARCMAQLAPADGRADPRRCRRASRSAAGLGQARGASAGRTSSSRVTEPGWFRTAFVGADPARSTVGPGDESGPRARTRTRCSSRGSTSWSRSGRCPPSAGRARSTPPGRRSTACRACCSTDRCGTCRRTSARTSSGPPSPSSAAVCRYLASYVTGRVRCLLWTPCCMRCRTRAGGRSSRC